MNFEYTITLDTYRALRKHLKELAAVIREQHRIRKLNHPEHSKAMPDYKVAWLSDEFRYKHLIYCMWRGTPYEKIEKKTRTKPEIVQSKINYYGAQYGIPKTVCANS